MLQVRSIYFYNNYALGFQEVESVRARLQYYSSLRRNLQSRLQDRGAC